MIRLVCFDLGGVLVRITNKIEELFRRAGISSEAGNFLTREMNQYDHFQAYQLGTISTKEYLTFFQSFEENSLSEEQLLGVHNAILIEPYSQTLELIQQIPVETACLSNTNAAHLEIMLKTDRFPNVRCFGRHFVSHEMHLAKPDRRIYQQVQNAYPYSPEEIVFFDDHLSNIEAAREHGWKAFLIRPDQETSPQIEGFLKELGVFSGRR